MKNYVDVKFTIWDRYYIDNSVNMRELMEKISKGEILPQNGIDESEGFIEGEMLFETMEFLPPNENNNQSTIEVYENDNLIWNNS